MSGSGHKDYSGTPLAAKLGIREGSRVLVVGAPPGFSLRPLPAGVELLTGARADLDVAVLFVTREAELRRRCLGLSGGLVDNKSASITEVFQGLQFVVRLRDRPGR